MRFWRWSLTEPVFASALLLAGDVSSAQMRLQLSRWVKAGRLLRLRRGLQSSFRSHK